MEKKFSDLAVSAKSKNYENLITREGDLYQRSDDIRDPFARDFTRILHSNAYRRLKHKTQVFCNIDNDHICTRMEHVGHVSSVATTIAQELGLNENLTRAIALGHDLGHAPFGHQGEVILKEFSLKHLNKTLWHEQNGVRFVDDIELLPDPNNVYNNLRLTFAVRDGIISHCGEVDENGLFPRDISIGIEDFDRPGKYQATTWEGCVVKMADKIGYLGRDIEDAVSLGILDKEAQQELLRLSDGDVFENLNTTVIIHKLILNITSNSSPDKGICLSPEYNQILKDLRDFNIKYIYSNIQVQRYNRYAELMLNEICEALLSLYDGDKTWEKLKNVRRYYPNFIKTFEDYIAKYCNPEVVPEELKDGKKYNNKKLYGNLDTIEIYCQAIVDFVTGMTDRFAVSSYNELLTFRA